MAPIIIYAGQKLVPSLFTVLHQQPWKHHLLFNLDLENIISQPWGATDEKTSNENQSLCLGFFSGFSPGWALITLFFLDSKTYTVYNVIWPSKSGHFSSLLTCCSSHAEWRAADSVAVTDERFKNRVCPYRGHAPPFFFPSLCRQEGRSPRELKRGWKPLRPEARLGTAEGDTTKKVHRSFV